MIDNNWIEDLLNKSKSNTEKEEKEHNNPLESKLITNLIDECYKIHKGDTLIPLGKLLASTFDLLISANYYSYVGHKGWYYCPTPTPSLYYHFTNCCPRHALGNIFYFHPASKPESGIIGKSTSRLLRAFLNVLLKKRGRSERILKGAEPVDVVIVNEEKNCLLFGEIKASPLLTLPLQMACDKLTDDGGKEITEHDGNLTINTIFNQQINLFVPKLVEGSWCESQYPFGNREDLSDKYWGYPSVIELLAKDASFLKNYYSFWNEALNKYHPKLTNSIYWLTNACGSPSPRTDWWPKSKGGDGAGFESVSDSKTSVGVDRTDDIKKGIYQVLKLGSEGKPVASKWKFKVGIISNIHAARHFEEYLESLKNLIWTHETTGKAHKAGDLNPEHPLYNLFDGIIALTESHFRDEWLKEVFGLENN
ncbi:hypothetical protein PN472_19340 [Microcystis aeruginosa CS-1036]|uniref:hypothetical protein n=1 Tax=Microcystis TaxID=1125 RepID=UPI00232B2CF9|nr:MULTISPECIES: hypothetical protein [Microcystis]MDB9403924.1 hypothetical protein [Microcystis sp. CS-574]MDB9545250.1 hypothetical protein [Microcystis aeruginosa CS-1036]